MGFLGQMSEEQYKKIQAIRSSELGLILKSPAHYKYWVGKTSPDNDAFRIGRIIHQAILEPTKFKGSYIVAPEFGDQRSSTNRKTKEEWLLAHQDRTVILADEIEMIEGMMTSVSKHQYAMGLLENGVTETAGEYIDPKTELKLKIKPDFMSNDHSILLDVKTTIDCSRSVFKYAIKKYKYHFQQAMYCEGIKQITGVEVKYPVIMAIEKKPPYDVAIYVLDQATMEMGKSMYRKALDTLARCRETNNWTGYQSNVETIGIPIFSEEMEDYSEISG